MGYFFIVMCPIPAFLMPNKDYISKSFTLLFVSPQTSCGGDCGASVPSKSSFKRVLGWMECDVCRDDYNTTTRRPLILHCGHTVCRQCVGRCLHHCTVHTLGCSVHEPKQLMIYCTFSDKTQYQILSSIVLDLCGTLDIKQLITPCITSCYIYRYRHLLCFHRYKQNLQVAVV